MDFDFIGFGEEFFGLECGFAGLFRAGDWGIPVSGTSGQVTESKGCSNSSDSGVKFLTCFFNP
jgi:hypothetical protein